jgi:oligopeptide transport system ATP-binding protein
MQTPLIEVQNLKKYFPVPGGLVKAVDGPSFTVDRGSTVGLVGESGCGKSTIGRTILNLIEPSGGEVRFDGESIYQLPRSLRRALRKRMGIVFQDPFSSLNPRMNLMDIVSEPLLAHTNMKGKALRQRVMALLEQVGLKPEHLKRYPHQFSGGQRQRIAIARALALDPEFLLFDEPTSALDVSVQAQVLNLIKKLQRKAGLTYLFITHDLNVVRHIADRVLIMYLGRLVEAGPVAGVFEQPLHPYTQALLASAPQVDPKLRRERVLIQGEIPSPLKPPPGCHFHPRCSMAEPVCRDATPELRMANGWQAACHLAGKKRN